MRLNSRPITMLQNAKIRRGTPFCFSLPCASSAPSPNQRSTLQRGSRSSRGRTVMPPPLVTQSTGLSRHRKFEIELCLHVNGVVYEYGKLCEFCEEGPATKHCPEDVCGFMCDDCDAYRHESGGNKTIEYADHVRAKVSLLDIPAACFKIKGFMLFMYHRTLMREEIRRQYSRFYSGKHRRHFYVFHRTQEVAWRKPLLLGNEELRPFLTRDQAVFKMQQLHRNWKKREVSRDAMRAEWSRVWSPQEKRFFFFYKGRSPLILPTSALWRQPCRNIGGIWVWRPVLSRDVAALRIQTMWRNAKGRKDLRALARQTYMLEHDPITGVELFRNQQTGEVSSRKPLVLGSERWDPDDMLLWTVEEVVLFFRRCGLKRYVPRVRHYRIDGALLMTFDPADFGLLGMIDTVHVKKILLAIERREAFAGYNERPKDLLRRAALRQRRFEESQAEIIQRWWREVRRALLRRLWKQTFKTAAAQAERERRIKESASWWTGRLRDYSGLNADIKMFGRRANILGVKGWGRWDTDGRSWTPAPEGVGAPHISRMMYRNAADGTAWAVHSVKELLVKEEQGKRRADRARAGI